MAPLSKGKEKVIDGYGSESAWKRKRNNAGDDAIRKRNRSVLQFFEDAADVGDDYCSDDSLFGEDFLEDDFGDGMGGASGSKMPTQPVNAPNLYHTPKEEQITDEEFDKMLEERYKPGSSFVTCAEDTYESKRSMETSTFLPSTKDPIIWKVKCMVGRERNSAFCLMQKYVDLKDQGTKLQIISVFSVDHVKGFIYIEAEKQSEIYEGGISVAKMVRENLMLPDPEGGRGNKALARLKGLVMGRLPEAIVLEYFTPKCSIIDTDVLNHIKTDKEVQEDLATSDPDCSVPILHLTTSIVGETDVIHLLAKSAYVDSLLTTLPVLTKEEQNILAANPAHPAGLIALYANCLAGNLVEQLWNFAWPVAIALLRPSLLPVAIIGFFTKLAVIFGGPLVGNLMDQFPRIASYNCLTVVQAAAQLLSVGMIIHGHTTCSTPVSCLLVQPWFVVLVIAGAIERLSGLALGVAMDRDWVVLLAGTNRPIALAQANALLSRIDLLCEIAGASLFGILLSRYEPVTCLKIAATLMISALPVTELVFLLMTSTLCIEEEWKGKAS